MQNRRISVFVVLFVCSAVAQYHVSAEPQAGLQLPATFKQKIEAGKTPVGTPVEAKLLIPTLINGQVVPKDALLSGHVEESQRHKDGLPARLRVKIDTLRWNAGAIRISAYLTNKYYPLEWKQAEFADDSLQSSQPSMNRRRRRQDFASPLPQGRLTSRPPEQPLAGRSESVVGLSAHRIPMPHVVPELTPSGMTLTSDHRIKLDKGTVYVFESSVAAAAAQRH